MVGTVVNHAVDIAKGSFHNEGRCDSGIYAASLFSLQKQATSPNSLPKFGRDVSHRGRSRFCRCAIDVAHG